MSAGLRFSRGLAYVFGIGAPLAETIRRWGTWREYPPAFFDDFILGAFLLAGAWATRGHPTPRGRALLAAAWGFTCAMGYSSTAFHWLMMRRGEPDPAPIPSEAVFAIKVIGSLLAVVALALTLADTPAARPAAKDQ
jgi:hypothetical protein